MTTRANIPPVRMLPDEVANKIAAGEVVERPASVVKELVENALDAGATRVTVRLVAAGRRTIEVIDNGHGMSEQDAVLSIERHATSKIRSAADLDSIGTLGFRGEALASIAAVSQMELVTRRERDEAATRIRVDGGALRSVSQVPSPVGTRVAVNRLYFNTPARAKFLKGMTTELSQCVDIVQRHALCHLGVGFQFFHNDKLILDVPENATLRERVALIWGLGLLRDMVELDDERDGIRVVGLIGTPALSRSHRSHQFFFMNGRPVVNRSLLYGFEDGYSELLTIGRYRVSGFRLLDDLCYSPGRFDSSSYSHLVYDDANPDDCYTKDALNIAGILPSVLRIVRRSNNPSTYLSYVESFAGVPWILGSCVQGGAQTPSSAHQTEHRIGFDCADLAVGAARAMGQSINYTGADALENSRPQRGNYGILLYDINQQRVEVWDASKNGAPVTVSIGTGANDLHIGDLLFLGMYPDLPEDPFDARHTTILKSDHNANGVLDGDDILVFAGHLGVTAEELDVEFDSSGYNSMVLRQGW